MPKRYPLNTFAISPEKSLKTLVENRNAYTLDNCELNIYETHQHSTLVPLTFTDFVVTSMLRGKKIMHLFDKPGFDYIPGETVLVPAYVTMQIDFPEASAQTPTQCIALTIDNNKIQQTLQFLNERYPRSSTEYWQFHSNHYHFLNNIELAQTINKLTSICSDSGIGKDILADLALQELIVRIIQTQHLSLADEADIHSNNPLSFITGYIKANINEKIEVAHLSAQACMSKATFYRMFKREYGISPLEYIAQERIKKAKNLLKNPYMSVTAVCYECGFSDLNYFVRMFKSLEGITPKQYQLNNLPQQF